jgi:hypothetical protein
MVHTKCMDWVILYFNYICLGSSSLTLGAAYVKSTIAMFINFSLPRNGYNILCGIVIFADMLFIYVMMGLLYLRLYKNSYSELF